MRLSLASCVLLATLFAPKGVRGQEPCACLGPDGAFGAATASAPGSAARAEQDAVSRPIDEIASLAQTPLAPVEHVLWCEGSDDPRCAPQQGQPDAPRVSVPGPALASVTWATPPSIDPALHRTPSVGAGPSAGVSVRVDRPPRA